LAIGGGAERYGFRPDLVAVGKAIANGFPLAAVGGRAAVMSGVSRTWISSTLATEFVALAAAKTTLELVRANAVPSHLGHVGRHLLDGLRQLHARYPQAIAEVAGVPEMCFLRYADDDTSRAVTRECARRGLLFKRTAYNFVSLAHDDAVVEWTLGALAEALSAVTASQ
jgi:glutamate-1-semialdehyde 2,1-aminomutase